MKHIKSLIENASAPAPINSKEINGILYSIGDYIEYIFEKYNYKNKRLEYSKHISEIIFIDPGFVDFDFQVEGGNCPNPDGWIRGQDIIKKLEPEEIAALKFNL